MHFVELDLLYFEANLLCSFEFEWEWIIFSLDDGLTTGATTY